MVAGLQVEHFEPFGFVAQGRLRFMAEDFGC